MHTYPFHLKVDDIQYWATRYLKYDNGEDEKAFEAGRRICGGEWTRENLVEIAAWKSKRSLRWIDGNSDFEIADALRLALLAKEPRSAFAVLMGLKGVAVPMASAILTAIDQRRFTVIDYRALGALGVPDVDYYKLDFYLHHYFPACARLATEHGVDLRTLDRALWAWSQAKGIRNERGNQRC
jgi:hypothetical protein